MTTLPTFFIKTYGCQMNQRDSEALSCVMEEHGFRQVDHESKAGIIIFNTCSVRDQAERKAIGKIGLMKKLKRENPHLVIGVIGCMAQNRPEEILDECPHVDFILGTDKLHEVPAVVAEILHCRRGIVNTDADDAILGQMGQHKPGLYSDFVSVMRGCDQFCSYCIVPYVRGREKSRSIADIVAEVERLVAGGTREIFLLGQNVTAYGLAELRQADGGASEVSPFGDLLRAVHAVPGVERIRFTSPHPKYMNEAFIQAIAELPRVCPSFHLPLQSGADRILALMNRGYTAADYLRWVDRLREVRPNATFSTDIIVGFPTETEAEFEATRAVMRRVGYDMAYIFKYSPRTGTKAAEKLPDDVPQEEKERRNQILLDELESHVAQANQAWIGQTVEVMVHGESKTDRRRWSGRTPENKVVIFTPRDGQKPGDLLRIRIIRATSHSLFGDIVAEA
jgi:tRNA-2-methylthio-N6-dimethylallyladenosine synthase